MVDELILKERETREKMVQVINDSQLPAILLKPILNDLLLQINNAGEIQYQEALSNKKIKEKKEKEEGK